MSVLFALLSLFALVHADKCCPRPLTPEEAFSRSEAVFLADLVSELVSPSGGTATLTLRPTEVYKGSEHILLSGENVHAKYPCAELPVPNRPGLSYVFFGSISQSDGGVIAVNLQPCGNAAYGTCELEQFRTGNFYESCTTKTEPTCTAKSSCVLAPSIIGASLLVVVFVFIMVVVRRRRRAMESNEIELADVSDSEVNATNYAYQPVMTSSPMGQQVMMTAQGPVVLNTQPMYMMTQTGESVVVQVAYI
jgi:hypothetical protein